MVIKERSHLRSGFSSPLPELGGENSESHYPITLDPKETGHQLVFLDVHGLMVPLPVRHHKVEDCKRKLDSMSGLLREVYPDNFCERTFEVQPLWV